MINEDDITNFTDVNTSNVQETMKSDSDIDILVEHESTFRERSVLPTIERAIAREEGPLFSFKPMP